MSIRGVFALLAALLVLLPIVPAAAGDVVGSVVSVAGGARPGARPSLQLLRLSPAPRPQTQGGRPGSRRRYRRGLARRARPVAMAARQDGRPHRPARRGGRNCRRPSPSLRGTRPALAEPSLSGCRASARRPRRGLRRSPRRVTHGAWHRPHRRRYWLRCPAGEGGFRRSRGVAGRGPATSAGTDGGSCGSGRSGHWHRRHLRRRRRRRTGAAAAARLVRDRRPHARPVAGGVACRDGRETLTPWGSPDLGGAVEGVGLGELFLPTTATGELWLRARRDDPAR